MALRTGAATEIIFPMEVTTALAGMGVAGRCGRPRRAV